MVDADHGYGNALNVCRTIEELEMAGVSGLSIEDTELPQTFGSNGKINLLSIDEGIGKMKAAISGRQDPNLVIAGRTSAPAITGVRDAIERALAYEAIGVDAIFLVGIKTRDEDSVVQTLSVDTHTSLLFFSTEGLAYKVKAWKIPEGSASSKGKSLFNILPLKNHQSISSIMPLPEEKSEWKNLNIVFATSKGKIRKNSLEDFININASGKIAMKLDPDDKIIGVKICREDQDIILSSLNGKSIRFNVEKIRLFKGRSSKGIRGINLKEKDMIVSLSTIDKDTKNGKKGDKFILSITENGFGKRTASNDFRVTNRGGKGIIGIVNSSRNGNVSSSFPVFEGDEILISTNKGRVIRVAVKEIRIAGRNTQGVRIIRLSGDEKVVSAIKIDDNLI